LSYRLDLSEDVLSKLEDLSRADAKILKQILIKCLSLRRTPKPQDCKELQNFNYQGLKGHGNFNHTILGWIAMSHH